MGIRVKDNVNPEDKETTDANTASIAFDHTDPNPNGAKPKIRMPDLGVLNGALSDPSITEIMVNDLRNIAIEKQGQIVVTPIRFKNMDELNAVVKTLLEPSGRELSYEHPLAITSLPDGSRVHVAGPPVTDFGPCITIRRFPRRYSLSTLMQGHTMDVRIAHFLNACILGRQNILISGGTGTGKTTVLNALISLIPPHERVITIEDTSEIPYLLPNQVKLMTKTEALGGTGITARELVANALRMRPDRIIVGECRGVEALDMIQAMNTGHQGSMTTIHANSPRDALYRLETLMMSAGLDLPLPAIRRQIANAIQLIVQIKRFPTGSRKIISIQEVTGTEQDILLLQEIFSYQLKNPAAPQDDSGTFEYNLSSTVVEELKALGIKPLP
jgi:pilus assembly protein CpaF